MVKHRFDIFIDGFFKGTICLKYPPRWVVSDEQLVSDIEQRLPTLRGLKWTIRPA